MFTVGPDGDKAANQTSDGTLSEGFFKYVSRRNFKIVIFLQSEAKIADFFL